eukprot:8952557-Karenia_brevis.AAC.1
MKTAIAPIFEQVATMISTSSLVDRGHHHSGGCSDISIYATIPLSGLKPTSAAWTDTYIAPSVQVVSGAADHLDTTAVAEPPSQYASLSQGMLKQLCKDRGMPVYGKKAVLIERLCQSDAIGVVGSQAATRGDDDSAALAAREFLQRAKKNDATQPGVAPSRRYTSFDRPSDTRLRGKQNMHATEDPYDPYSSLISELAPKQDSPRSTIATLRAGSS